MKNGATKKARKRFRLQDSKRLRLLQDKLYQKIAENPNFQFSMLYDRLSALYILRESFKREKNAGGRAGIDGLDFSTIEKTGTKEFLDQLANELRAKAYRSSPATRSWTLKDKKPSMQVAFTIKDRIVQTSCKLIIEQIFAKELGLTPNEDGTIPQFDGMSYILETLQIPAYHAKALELFFRSISHDTLFEKLRKHVVDRQLIRLIMMWIVSPVIEVSERGKKRYTKISMNKQGLPMHGELFAFLACLAMPPESLLDKIRKMPPPAPPVEKEEVPKEEETSNVTEKVSEEGETEKAIDTPDTTVLAADGEPQVILEASEESSSQEEVQPTDETSSDQETSTDEQVVAPDTDEAKLDESGEEQ